MARRYRVRYLHDEELDSLRRLDPWRAARLAAHRWMLECCIGTGEWIFYGASSTHELARARLKFVRKAARGRMPKKR